MRRATVLKIVAGGVVLVVGAVVVVLLTLDFGAYKGEITKLVRDTTGRELVIEGDLDISLGLTPAITVKGVRFANASWGSRPDMARIDEFRAEVELLPILFGEIVVKQIVLSGADILLETGPRGTGNWAIGGEAKAGELSPDKSGGVEIPTVSRLLIENTVISWRDGQSEKVTRLRVAELLLTSSGPDRPLSISYNGSFNDSAVRAEGAIGSLAAALRGQAPLTVALKAQAGGAEMTANGKLVRPMEGAGLTFEVALKGTDLSELGKPTGIALPATPPYALSATVSDTRQGWMLDGLKLSLGKSDLAGNVEIVTGGRRPEIRAVLSSRLLRQQDLPGDTDAAPPSPKSVADDGRLFPADPLSLDGIGAVDATLRIKVARIEAAGKTIQPLSANLILKAGIFRLRKLRAVFEGGKISADVTLRRQSGEPSMALKAEVSGLDLGALTRDGDQPPQISGRLNVAATLSGKGRSVRAIMAGLNGSIETTIEGGRLENALIGSLSTDVVSAISPFSSKQDGLKINCLVGRYDIRKGQLSSRVTLFDTDRATVTAEGGIDLGSEAIDFVVKPTAKEVSLVSLAVPIRIGGTLANPEIYPDPAGVAKSAIGTVAGIVSGVGIVGALLGAAASNASADDNPCLKALAPRSIPSNKTGSAQPDSPPQKGLIDSILKGVDQGLKGLFGQ
jgi:hypothetical protein